MSRSKFLPILAGAIGAATVLAIPQARADIVSLAGTTNTTNVTGYSGIQSLTAIENGSDPLTFGLPAGTSGAYEVVNDTGSTASTISFTWAGGTIAENHFINIQFGGGLSGTAFLSPNDLSCTTCGGNNGHADFFDPDPGGMGSTQFPTGPVTFTWSSITSPIANGADFNITFASWANGDTTSAVPAPVIGHGLLTFLAIGGVLFGGRFLENLKKRRSLTP